MESGIPHQRGVYTFPFPHPHDEFVDTVACALLGLALSTESCFACSRASGFGSNVASVVGAVLLAARAVSHRCRRFAWHGLTFVAQQRRRQQQSRRHNREQRVGDDTMCHERDAVRRW